MSEERNLEGVSDKSKPDAALVLAEDTLEVFEDAGESWWIPTSAEGYKKAMPIVQEWIDFLDRVERGSELVSRKLKDRKDTSIGDVKLYLTVRSILIRAENYGESGDIIQGAKRAFEALLDTSKRNLMQEGDVEQAKELVTTIHKDVSFYSGIRA